MNKINLKDSIWIEGFESYTSFFKRSSVLISFNYITFGKYNILYSGRTSEITEELAKECVIQNGLIEGTLLYNGEILKEDHVFGYKQYKKGFGGYELETARESIQSACNKEFCIIYKTN